MSHFSIKEIKSYLSDEYKDFFTKGLIDETDNFRISPADEKDLNFPTHDREDSFTLGAYVNDRLAGVVSFQREGANREKLRHKGLLFRMYVQREHSGQGIGSALIQKVLDRTQALPNLEQINLTVIASNPAARHLYQKFGFKSYSLEKQAVKFKGKYFDEESMVLFIPHQEG
ncbi:GNAT family N-acetyltransferase [Reichenbachiella ulvae]|uniref:GNAT family N-acetyltransferase n=1 Tax=Reichenbachiella ulvae TaxID=2980104 RepID=A0ABT3CX62_9BACT|nr:GNAT family N-acetyltransferase [Reichenbachiella ulvae]MCV9388184.1 GNAT family N-acetyltransferase [Reichenbachiella ulvae]